MIIGAHAIIYSANAEADRGFFRDVLKLTNVDVGDGWLIFGLPPAEVAVHSSDRNGVHELYLTCQDVQAFVAEIFDSDEPPFFKNFLRLEVEPGALTIKAYGVTGWADDEKDPQREDCVRIPLPVERPRRFSADGGVAAADPSRSATPGSPQ